MPVDVNLPKEGMIYQREQYQKGGIGRWYWDYRDRKIIKYLVDSKCTEVNKRIIDIGCGEGILIEKILQMFPEKEIIGIDPSKENIEICKAHNLKVYHGSVYSLPFNDLSVDCVLLIEVIEHLDHPDKAISEIKRILKKNAFFIILFPHDIIFKYSRIITFKLKEAFYDSGHVKQWTPKEMHKFLVLNGFEIISRKNLPCHIWLISLHCLMVARKL